MTKSPIFRRALQWPLLQDALVILDKDYDGILVTCYRKQTSTIFPPSLSGAAPTKALVPRDSVRKLYLT